MTRGWPIPSYTQKKLFLTVVIRRPIFIFTRKGYIVECRPLSQPSSLNTFIADSFPGRSEGYAHPELRRRFVAHLQKISASDGNTPISFHLHKLRGQTPVSFCRAQFSDDDEGNLSSARRITYTGERLCLKAQSLVDQCHLAVDTK